MEIIVEIVHYIIDRFNSCLVEVLQVFEEIIEEEKENKVIKKKLKKGE